MRLDWYGGQYAESIATEVKLGIMECGDDLRGKSIDEAPIDTGELRRDCVVDTSDIGKGGIKVGYTAEVDDYSMVQHERMDFNHPNGGKAKYLEDPFNANKDQYTDHIGAAVGRGTQ